MPAALLPLSSSQVTRGLPLGYRKRFSSPGLCGRFRQRTLTKLLHIGRIQDDTRSRETRPSGLSRRRFWAALFLEAHRRGFLRDDLGTTVSGSEAERAVAELNKLGAEVAIPFMSEDTLLALLIIGPKLSGDAYFSDDLELLSTLSNQAAIAMQNAQLYRQVLLANEYIENILGTMENGVVAIDSLRHITLCNKAAERMTGLTAVSLRHQGGKTASGRALEST